ncbi:thiol:disulfide interchange protein DsbA/DsbL [Alteromonas sp. 5E99-2]|uniref:thiol:disulfide interchange protein DsbA/DsbL n=1 Tax=Alteromonas sp. 5E99-2 TaxID=2817683 RepID=UPI001A9838C0|nr:thiol:disulfide interchange protein DsbA/DsbL [Alteromonas sp. 5E99-2]MBO1257010.1 thiol:disulfide interchange protein DsbA/DsbL [Alteromonas sp. 5E99-2]
MKKLALLFVLSVAISFQGFAQELWKEGEHYVVLDKPAAEKPVIREYFSFWCPHCFNFEPLVAQIKEKKADNVKLEKVHVNFMGFTSPEIQEQATRAMMVARALKREDELSNAIFKHIHVGRGVVANLDDLKAIFVENGVDAAEFDKLASSFGVNNFVKRNNKSISDYRQFLTGVPNFIVNGKYQVKFTRDMTPDDIVNLIVWLSTQP